MLSRVVWALCAGFLAFPSSGRADAVADFYRGRTITVVIGYTAGGGYDVHARTLARYMGRYIPGNPNLVPQNMPGAGSLVAANYLYNVAQKDGSVFGTFGRGLPMEPLIGTGKTQFDARKFTWIGSSSNELSVCAVRSTVQVKSFEDLLTKEIAVGGEGGGSDPDTFATLVKNLFGAKIKLVTGYPGGNEMMLAIERGEIDGRCGWSWSVIKSGRPEWIAQKKLNVLAQMSLERSPELPDVPAIIEMAKDERQKEILKLVFARQVFGRPFTAPPGVPEDRKQALRSAFDKTMKDPEFLAEATKLGLEIEPVSGAEVEKLVAEIYETPKEVVEETKNLISARPGQ